MLVLSNCAMFVLHITRSLSCRNCGCWWQVPRISKLFDAWLLWSSSGLPATVCGSSGHMSHPCIAPDQDLDECRAVLHNWQPTNSSRCARIIRCFGCCKALVIESKQSSVGFTLLLEGYVDIHLDKASGRSLWCGLHHCRVSCFSFSISFYLQRICVLHCPMWFLCAWAICCYVCRHLTHIYWVIFGQCLSSYCNCDISMSNQ